jgi:hypothetical protein
VENFNVPLYYSCVDQLNKSPEWSVEYVSDNLTIYGKLIMTHSMVCWLIITKEEIFVMQWLTTKKPSTAFVHKGGSLSGQPL